MNRQQSLGTYTYLYDGLVWEQFQSVNGTPFLQLPNNPFKHVEYSAGVIYLDIANLPRSERYKIENVIIVVVLPGPKEPKKHMNSYLKPLVDELLQLWKGTYLTAPGVFVPIRCALLCVSCDLPATRKVCSFTLRVFNETVISSKSKGNHSSAVCANWAGVGGSLATNNYVPCIGLIQYFIRHTIRFPVSKMESKKIVHIFARIFWFKAHPRENWFSHRALVVSPDMSKCGPATFLPISRIRCRCVIIDKTVTFEYGQDNVTIAILRGANYSV